MQNPTSVNNIAATASANRRIAVRKKVGKKRNGNSEGRSHVGAVRGTVLHLLSKELRSVPMFEAQLLQKPKHDSKIKDLLTIIDTEEKQLQCISDLLEIVKAQPVYKKLKEPSFAEGTEPIRIIQWLLRKLGPLTKGNDWTVDTYKEKRKIRYSFVMKKHYTNWQVRLREVWFALDFLPALGLKDKQLHDMIIEVVALISKGAKILLWDEDGDLSEAIDELLGERNYSDELRSSVFGSKKAVRHQNQRAIYRDGIARQYLDLIKARRVKASRSSYTKIAQGYYKSDMSARKKSMVYWLIQGINVSEMKEDVSMYTFIPGYEANPNDVGSPFRKYKFAWSAHRNDVVNVIATQNYLDDYRSVGGYYPLRFSIAKPGEALKPLKTSKANGYQRSKDFMELLDEWIGTLEYLITRKYKDYYYKNSFDKQTTPAEDLLERIEISQTKHEHRKRK